MLKRFNDIEKHNSENEKHLLSVIKGFTQDIN